MSNNLLPIIVLIAMIAIHIKYDFKQGLLAEFKQKSWWKKEFPDKDWYKMEWVLPLLLHGFLWTTLIMIPPTLYLYYIGDDRMPTVVYVMIFLGNTLIHALVDHLKANIRELNLTEDQLLHISQIIFTWLSIIL